MHGTFYAFESPLQAHQSKLGNFIATQFCHIFERFFGTTPLCHTLIGKGQLLAHGSEVSGKDQFRNPNIGEIEPSIRSLRSGTGYGITEYVLSTEGELDCIVFANHLSLVKSSRLSYSTGSCYQDLPIFQFQLRSMTSTSEKYSRKQQGNLLSNFMGNGEDLSYAFDINELTTQEMPYCLCK